MCLIINISKHPDLACKVADTDIVCYKELHAVPYGSSVIYTTPYIHFPVDIHADLVADCFQETPRNVHSDTYGKMCCYTIEHAIHTLLSPVCVRYQNVLFKCAIPAGTRYWEGWGGEYASERIRFVQEVNAAGIASYLMNSIVGQPDSRRHSNYRPIVGFSILGNTTISLIMEQLNKSVINIDACCTESK